MTAEAPITAVIFDLDDTLYLQHTWLDGVWVAIANSAPLEPSEQTAFAIAMERIAAGGSDQGGIIDKGLDAIGRSDIAVAPLVDVFRAHRPNQLALFDGVRSRLMALSSLVPLGLVSDGDVSIQEAKLDLLDLRSLFPVIVLSDRFGREHRKPDSVPFEAALALLDVDAQGAVFVGDRPEKDIVGPARLGMRAIRVLTGEYATGPDVVPPWRTEDSACEAIDTLLSLVG